MEGIGRLGCHWGHHVLIKSYISHPNELIFHGKLCFNLFPGLFWQDRTLFILTELLWMPLLCEATLKKVTNVVPGSCIGELSLTGDASPFSLALPSHQNHRWILFTHCPHMLPSISPWSAIPWDKATRNGPLETFLSCGQKHPCPNLLARASKFPALQHT